MGYTTRVWDPRSLLSILDRPLYLSFKSTLHPLKTAIGHIYNNNDNTHYKLKLKLN